jgi:hypothetical protein
LGVKDSPRNCSFLSNNNTSGWPLPVWAGDRVIFPGKRTKEATEGVVFGAEDSGDVFPEDDGGWLASNRSNMVNCICYSYKGQRKITASVIKGVAQTCHAEGLAWCAATEHVWGLHLTRQDALWQCGHVAQVGHIWVVVSQNSRREWLNLREPRRLPPQRMPRN